jgi:hypothetical protein
MHAFYRILAVIAIPALMLNADCSLAVHFAKVRLWPMLPFMLFTR